MAGIIRGKIDVSKIDKDRLFRGQKGTYLDFVLIPTPDSQYGDTHVVRQEVSKEEREAGVKGAILGNAKEVSTGNGQPKAAAPRKEAKFEDPDLPF